MAGRSWLVALAAASLLSCAAPDWTDCPVACRCKWTSGKKTALCRDAALSAIPTHLSSDMQVLDLGGNSIPILEAEAFRSVGLINLQRVFLRAAGLRKLHRDAFAHLIILVELDLSDNEISSLTTGTFAGNERLRVLLLSGNPLGRLGEAQFPPLPHLRTLELRRCRLSMVHRDAFVHLAALESLDLRSNHLRQLSEAVFMSTGRLNTLALDGNPWRCDCQLRGFRNWFLSSRLRSVPLVCEEPERLSDRPWRDVPAIEFACAPAVALTDTLVRADVGGNVTFGCNVRGDPEPEVTWLYNGRPIGAAANGSQPDPATLVIEVEEGLLEKWSNVSVFNVSELDAGEYSCVARNSEGSVARNVSLLLPEVVTATTLSKDEPTWLVWVVAAGGGMIAAVVALGAACCAWSRGRRRRAGNKRHRRKGQLKGSASFSDQEKKLLDVSITTTTEREGGRGSCELLQAELELLEQQPPSAGPLVPAVVPGVELCDPPVHITIESHQQSRQMANDPGSLPVAVFPPPPPEFSTSVLPAGAFGNIFISVSVSSQEAGPLDVARYPDLLDVARREPQHHHHHLHQQRLQSAASSVATLPRRQLRMGPQPPSLQQPSPVPEPPPSSHYDNMGPRVTAGGSSTLSLPDAVAPLEDIPPPPPPPACTPHTSEYVSL